MSAKKYAEGSSVSVGRSVQELQRLVTKYGATGFGYVYDEQAGRVQFVLAGRMIRFDIARPNPAEHASTPTGLSRSREGAMAFAQQEEARRWRAIVLYVKALLVATEDGAITPEQAFLSHTVLPTNQTTAQWLLPQFDQLIAGGAMPKQLMT